MSGQWTPVEKQVIEERIAGCVSCFTKRRLAKFNDVKVHFDLQLRERELRYNKPSSFLFRTPVIPVVRFYE